MVLTKEEEVEISKFFVNDATTEISISAKTDLSGFHGCYFSLEVKGHLNSKCFIKSVPDGDAVVDKYYSVYGIFVKEVKIYQNLFPKMANLGKVWPDCRLAKEGRYLVLEDMVDSGWRTASSMDDIHIAVALRGIAKFHSSSMIILNEAENLDIFKTVAVETMLSTDSKSPGRQMWNAFSRICHQIYDIYFPDSGIDVFGVFQNVVDVVNRPSGFRQCLNHGDPWMNNILFKYNNEVPTEASFVDFQSARIAPPALDVSIFLSVIQPDRVEFLATSIYYDCLSQILFDQNVEVPSREEFLEAIKYFKKTSKCIAALYIMLTKLPVEYVSKVLIDQKSFIKFALGQNNSIVWEALKNNCKYRKEFLKYLCDAISCD